MSELIQDKNIQEQEPPTANGYNFASVMSETRPELEPEVEKQAEQQEAKETGEVYTLAELAKYTPPPEDELIKNKFLCRGSDVLFCSQTGCGKSSFVMQWAMTFALGKPFFGFEPTRPLKTLIVQGENDKSDMYDEYTGIKEGFYQVDQLTKSQFDKIENSVTIWHCNKQNGEEFVDLLRSKLQASVQKFDLLILDPLFSYIGCDISKEQSKVSEFIRNKWKPLLEDFKLGGIIVHHTNKPIKNAQNDSNYNMAYDYAGSAEVVNAVRAMVIMEGKLDSAGQKYYKITAPKRGRRLAPQFEVYGEWPQANYIHWIQISKPQEAPADDATRKQEKRESQQNDKERQIAKQAVELIKPGEEMVWNRFKDRIEARFGITNRQKVHRIANLCVEYEGLEFRQKLPGEKLGHGVKQLIKRPETPPEYSQDELI